MSGPRGPQWAPAPPVSLFAGVLWMNLSLFSWRSYAQVYPCVCARARVGVRACAPAGSPDISLAPSAPLKIRRRAERMKADKVQNKDERRNKRRVASLLFRPRTMFGLFSHALYSSSPRPPPVAASSGPHRRHIFFFKYSNRQRNFVLVLFFLFIILMDRRCEKKPM